MIYLHCKHELVQHQVQSLWISHMVTILNEMWYIFTKNTNLYNTRFRAPEYYIYYTVYIIYYIKHVYVCIINTCIYIISKRVCILYINLIYLRKKHKILLPVTFFQNLYTEFRAIALNRGRLKLHVLIRFKVSSSDISSRTSWLILLPKLGLINDKICKKKGKGSHFDRR